MFSDQAHEFLVGGVVARNLTLQGCHGFRESSQLCSPCLGPCIPSSSFRFALRSKVVHEGVVRILILCGLGLIVSCLGLGFLFLCRLRLGLSKACLQSLDLIEPCALRHVESVFLLSLLGIKVVLVDLEFL